MITVLKGSVREIPISISIIIVINIFLLLTSNDVVYLLYTLKSYKVINHLNLYFGDKDYEKTYVS